MIAKKQNFKKEIKKLKEKLNYHKKRDIFFSSQWLLIKKKSKEIEKHKDNISQKADKLLTNIAKEIQKIYIEDQNIENEIIDLKKINKKLKQIA